MWEFGLKSEHWCERERESACLCFCSVRGKVGNSLRFQILEREKWEREVLQFLQRERERERCKEEKKSSEERREGKVDETVCF